MDVLKIKQMLKEQSTTKITDNLYHKTQLEFAYHNNCIDDIEITLDELTDIYKGKTLKTDKIDGLDSVDELKNHFTLFKYMIDTLEEPLTEEIIKTFHLILKTGMFVYDEDKFLNVGEYKLKRNFIGTKITSLPSEVEKAMRNLLREYNRCSRKDIKKIIEFHSNFEWIHPFQNANGRVGRMIMFRECLVNNIMPFYIDASKSESYMRGLKEYQIDDDEDFLNSICIKSQKSYEKLVRNYLENDE